MNNMKVYTGDYLIEIIEKIANELVYNIEEKKKINIEETQKRMEYVLNLLKSYNKDVEDWFETPEFISQRRRVDEVLITQEKVTKLFRANNYFAEKLDELEQ